MSGRWKVRIWRITRKSKYKSRGTSKNENISVNLYLKQGGKHGKGGYDGNKEAHKHENISSFFFRQHPFNPQNPLYPSYFEQMCLQQVYTEPFSKVGWKARIRRIKRKSKSKAEGHQKMKAYQ